MADNNQPLEVRTVSLLTGRFHIPAYQRGYRWEHRQVTQLLDDLLAHCQQHPRAGETPYYLQPIVVAPIKSDEEGSNHDNLAESQDSAATAVWNLIDGQQRLTTIFLLLKFLEEEQFVSRNDRIQLLKGLDLTPRYEISYETRSNSVNFMKKLPTGLCNPELTAEELEAKEHALREEARRFPDFLYMWHAYQAIRRWFNDADHYNEIKNIADALLKDVKIIWYELNHEVTEWKKFSELNVGKIPLTNSELVKALLMRSENKEITDEQKNIIIQQWDAIEKELDDDSFWAFLSSRQKSEYSTRIDLIFDIIAKKPKSSKDEFFTFNYFERLFSAPNAPKGKDKWNNIYLQYQRLREWYFDPELYHKIGYLSVIGNSESLFQELFNFVSTENEKTKELPTNKDFKNEIESRIVKSLSLPAGVKKIDDLAYQIDDRDSGHQGCIHKVLTLYNVLYTHNQTKDRYDFASHRNADGGWSLEHIHARNSQELPKDQQREWLKSHVESLVRFRNTNLWDKNNDKLRVELDSLAKEMTALADSNDKHLSREAFNAIAERYSSLIVSIDNSDAQKPEYEHRMDNMALLGRNENAAFNNSTFDVKRHKMLRDMATEHIPVCTRRVFLKAIPDADDNRPFFWGETDRKAYIADMRSVLSVYLKEVEPKIKEEKEADTDE